MTIFQIKVAPSERKINYKGKAIDQINERIGIIRQRYVTTIPGQEGLYLMKENEAARYISDPSPDIADYPLIAAEIGITAPDAYQIAQLWLNVAAQWREVASQLETIRLGHVLQVETATNREQVVQILESFELTVNSL